MFHPEEASPLIPSQLYLVGTEMTTKEMISNNVVNKLNNNTS
jgi:hypothetical protein